MPAAAVPADPATIQPLRALWRRYDAYRARFVGAVVASTVNKVADVVPELLIGAAVDVVVRGEASFVGDVLGVESRFAQLGWLAVINAVVWVVESLSQYVASVLWRGLAEVAEKFLKKGQSVFIEGKIRTSQYQDKEGNQRYSTEIVADNMTMLTRGEGGQPEGGGNYNGGSSTAGTYSGGAAPTAAGVAQNDEPDDLPF